MHPSPLEAAQLLTHARAAARADERRHAATSTTGATTQHNEQTLRGWGGAALLDLEWRSHCVYSKVERAAYAGAYATEYLRVRAVRSARPTRSAAPTAGPRG
jgi:hypothetical protein